MGIIRKSFRRQTEMEYLLAHGMKIGNNCHIYSDSTIDHTYPHLISIGNNVTISTNVTILAHDASTNVVEGGGRNWGECPSGTMFLSEPVPSSSATRI